MMEINGVLHYPNVAKSQKTIGNYAIEEIVFPRTMWVIVRIL